MIFGSAVLGAFFDNIPYVATMAPIVEDMVGQASDPAAAEPLWWAFAAGRRPGRQRYGGRRERERRRARHRRPQHGQPISFWQFTRYGIVTTAVTAVLAWAYVWLRYYAAV